MRGYLVSNLSIGADFTKELAGSDRWFGEVTHVYAYVQARYGPERVETEVRVSEGWEHGGISIDVGLWEVDESGGIAEYELAVAGSGLGYQGGPCAGSCRLTVQAWDRSGGQDVMLGYITSNLNVSAEFSKELVGSNWAFTDATHLYAYVASRYDSSAERAVTEREVSPLIMDGYDLWALAPPLVGLALTQEQLCAVLLEYEPQTNFVVPSTSLPDAPEVCLNSLGPLDAMKNLMKLVGPAAVLALMNSHDAGYSVEDLAKSLGSPVMKDGRLGELEYHEMKYDDGAIAADPPPQSEVEALADYYISLDPSLAEELEDGQQKAEVVARECLDWTSFVTGLGLILDDDPCRSYDIYFPGADVDEATIHRAVAIIDDPARVRLHRADSNARRVYISEAFGYSDPWYDAFDPCTIRPRPTGTACDEYPNMATQEGGPGEASAIGSTASLALIDSIDNSGEGANLRSFFGKAKGCDIVSAPAKPPYLAPEFAEFLVIPVPAWPVWDGSETNDIGVPTIWKCGNGRIGGPGSA